MKAIPGNIIAISSEENIIDIIAEHLQPDGYDYSGNIVIFPNKRPAHFLRRRLALKTGSAFIPPRIFAIDEFIDYIYEFKNKDKKIDGIDAVAILYNLHRKSLKRLGGVDFIELDSFFPLGLKIFRDIEELCIEKVDTEEVKNIDSLLEGIPPETYSRLERLSYFYGQFYKITSNLGYSTRSWRYRASVDRLNLIDLEGFKRIILAGFFALTKSEIDLFKAILSRNNSLLIFKDGPHIEEKVKELGINFKSSAEGARKQEIFFYSSPDSHGQIFGISRLLKDKIENKDPIDEQSAIIVPAPDNIFPLIHNSLSLLQPDSYNISIGYPLFRTPIFAFFNNLMELMLSMNEDKFYIPDYIKFVLHPYVKNIYLDNQPELTRIIFHTLEDELSRNRTISFLSLEEIENNPKVLTDLDESIIGISKDTISNHLRHIHENTILKFNTFKNIEDFARKCTEVLIYIYNNSTARRHPLFHPFCEAFLLAFDKISSSLIKELSFPNINGYFTFFKKYILTCNSPFEGTPLKGLQILGFLESRNLSFNDIYIIDLNEDILPATQKEASLIPFAVRKRLGLPTYIDSDIISEYYFETLIRGAKRVHLFFVENDKTEKSRFIEKILWEKEKENYPIDARSNIKSIQYKVSLKNIPPKEINKTDRIITALEDFIFTASSLDCYLKCGLSFYYNYVLTLQKKEDITAEIEKSDIGIFVHEFLSKYFKKLKGQRLNKRNLDIINMEDLFKKLSQDKFGKNPSGSAYLIQQQLKKHLYDFIKNYYMKLAEDLTIKIVDCECEIEVTVDSYTLKGRIDSIEERNKRQVIIDYKTSSYENNYKIHFEKLNMYDKDSWQKAIGSLQLPFYMLLYLESTKTEISDLDAMFLLLGKNTISEKIELPFCDCESHKEENYKILKQIIFSLIEEIRDINSPFSPPLDLKKTCLYCDYKNMCGTK